MFIRVHSWLKNSARTCCAARLDPTCAVGMPPLRVPPSSYPSIKKTCVPIRVHPCPSVVEKSARTCCAARLDSTCAAGMPPLRSSPGKRFAQSAVHHRHKVGELHLSSIPSKARLNDSMKNFQRFDRRPKRMGCTKGPKRNFDPGGVADLSPGCLHPGNRFASLRPTPEGSRTFPVPMPRAFAPHAARPLRGHDPLNLR